MSENNSPVLPCECGDHCFRALTKGFVTLVSPQDEELLSAFNWYADKGRNTFYVQRAVAGTTKRLHRDILCPQPGRLVDHESGDGLDNRRRNLRESTPAQNSANRIVRSPTSASGYMGVKKCGKQWAASITQERGVIYLGLHKTREAAAKARDAEAFRQYGVFANFNFPEDFGLPPPMSERDRLRGIARLHEKMKAENERIDREGSA